MCRFFFACTTSVCSLVLLATGGCNGGPPTGKVSGTVTMDGQPLENALVTFVPQEGGQAAVGKTDASGKYELYRVGAPGALVGTHRVSVTTIQQPAAAGQQPGAAATGSDEYANQSSGRDAYRSAPVFKETIPARYNTSSELTKEVTKGTNEINLELTST